MNKLIKLYGASWCTKSSALRNLMQQKWISFEDFDVEEDKEAEMFVRGLYDGQLKFPTLLIGDKHYKNPSPKVLVQILTDEGVI